MLNPYHGCKIDTIDVRQLTDGTFDVILLHDVFTPPAIPEMFGFKNIEIPLIPYLEAKGIPYVKNLNPIKIQYGLNLD